LTDLRGDAASATDPASAPAPVDGKGVDAGPVNLTLQFEDNRLAPLVFGGHDQHLALIEQRLGVQAVAHGNVLTVTGPGPATRQAKAVLEGLYARVKKGEHPGAGDVEGLIRHTLSAWRRSARGGKP
jgi:phosphate starvation-inducible protein PhoH and related proteins